MHTKDFLAQELRAAGLENIAKKAEDGYYHDFLSPLPFPELQLTNDLTLANTPAALALLKRHYNGEFDATMEESNAWAEGPEGQEAMSDLTKEFKK